MNGDLHGGRRAPASLAGGAPSTAGAPSMSLAAPGASARGPGLAFACRHDQSAARACNAAEAAEAFCQCVEKHVLAQMLPLLEREEAEVRRLEGKVARMGRVEGEVARRLRDRVSRAGSVLRRAREVYRSVAHVAENQQGDEGEGGERQAERDGAMEREVDDEGEGEGEEGDEEEEEEGLPHEAGGR